VVVVMVMVMVVVDEPRSPSPDRLITVKLMRFALARIKFIE
jgi:hypothetical protein